MLRKTPAAWIPLLMSGVAFLLVIFHALIFGISEQEDEGIAAHLFQLLMVGQLPFVIYFAFKWLQKKPVQTIKILLLQALAIVIAFTPLFILEY